VKANKANHFIKTTIKTVANNKKEKTGVLA